MKPMDSVFSGIRYTWRRGDGRIVAMDDWSRWVVLEQAGLAYVADDECHIHVVRERHDDLGRVKGVA